MADPLLQSEPNDVGPAYLARRERAQVDEDISFLTAGEAQASEAQAAPAESILKPILKEIPPTIAKQGVDEAVRGAEGFSVDKAMDMAGRAAADIGEGVFQESPRAIVGGMRDAADEFKNSYLGLVGWLYDKSPDWIKLTPDDFEGLASAEQLAKLRSEWPDNPALSLREELTLPDIAEPDSVTGGMIRDVAQFITGFIPALRVAKAAKVGAVSKVAGKTAGGFAEASLAGAIADATVFDPHEQRLADMIEQYPQLQNPVTDYLSAKPDDSEAEARFKRALEGLGMGAVTEGMGLALKGLRSVRAARAAKKAAESGDEAAKGVRHEVQDAAEDNLVQVEAENALPALGDARNPIVQMIKVSDDQVKTFRGPLIGDDKVAVPNLARIDTEDDVKSVIAKTAEVFSDSIDEARRGKISNEETAKLASDLGMTVDDLLSRRRGEAFNAEEALAARQIMASSAEQLTTLAKRAATVDASQADVAAFRRALAIHTSIQSQVSGMTAEAGRALQSFRIMARGASDRDRQIKEMIDGHGGDLFNRDMAQRLADIAAENPEGLHKAAREMERVSGWDQLYEVWVNGLLSGPQTHAVNTLSNTLVAMWQVPERYLASKIGQAFGDAGVQAGEASAQAFGMVRGFKDGFRLAAKALRSGEGSDLIGKVEQSYRAFTADNFAGTAPGRVVNKLTAGSLENGGIAARAVDLLGEVARVPSRFLQAEDELFKAVGYRMELNAHAYRTAMAEGLEGDDLAKRIADIVANPPENIHMAAVDAARYQTFTKPLGEAGQAAQKWIRKVPGLRLVAPFVRTPTNILKFVGERTPLAFMSKGIRADIAAGGARRDLALARIGLGSMTMAVASDLVSGGHVTGGGPSDGKLKAHLRNTGWQPYSVKIGDEFYSYNRLDPLGMMLGLAADTTEVMGQAYGEDGEASADELAMAAVMALAKNTTSKTWLTGISDLIDTIEDPDRNAARFLSKFAGTIIPTGVAQTNRTFSDPVLRDTKDLDLWGQMVNQIKSRTPGYSDDLPPRTNVWGEPIVLGGGLGPDIVSPIYQSKAKSSPADEEILRLGTPITMPSRVVEGVKLKPEEYHRFVVLSGNELKDPSTGLGFKDTLDRLVTGKHPLSSAYKRASEGADGGKALMIQRLMTGFRDAAKAEVMKEFPELRALVNQAKRDKAKALTGQ